MSRVRIFPRAEKKLTTPDLPIDNPELQEKLTRRIREQPSVTEINDHSALSGLPLLTVSNLKMYFPVRKGLFGRPSSFVKAVDDVSFTIQRGETLGIVGESGSGAPL